MNNKIYRLVQFYLYDHTGIQRYLEKMAAKGWLLDKLGAFWRFRRIPPQKLRFAVTYFPEASTYDPGPPAGQWDYRELCRDAGWTHAATAAQLQIFYTDALDPVPLETDPRIQVETIHRAMRRSQIPSQAMLAIMGLAELFLMIRQYRLDPVEWLSSGIMFLLPLCWIQILVGAVVNLATYFRWYKAAKAAALEGEFTPTRGHRRLETAFLSFSLLIILLHLLFSLDSRMGMVSLLSGLLMVGCAALVSIGVSSLLKRKKVSARVNRVVSVLTVILFVMVMMSGMIALLFRSLRGGWLEEKRLVETYQYNGATFEVYGDPIPLRIEDLTETDYNGWSTERRYEASPLLARRKYQQSPRIDDSGYPRLEYTVLDVKAGFLYGLVERCMLEEAERHNEPNLPEFWDVYVSADPATWGAIRAYQEQSGGEPRSTYLLCYEDRLVELKLRHWEDNPTAEQMQVVGEILGT